MRPSKYESHVKPRLEEITEWRSRGWTHQQIADALHIDVAVLYKYKKQYNELNEALKKDWVDLIDEDLIVRSIKREAEAHTVLLHKTRMAWNSEKKDWDELKESWEQYVPANTSLINKYLDLKYRNAGPEDQEEQAVMVMPARSALGEGETDGESDLEAST